MFEASHKPVDNGHTLTALIANACAFVLSVWIFFRPLTDLALNFAAAASAVCLAAAWVNGKCVLQRRVAPMAVIPIAATQQGGK
jgi:hypothetical protein